MGLLWVHVPYLLPEKQGRGQDAQDGQDADEAGEQELLGALGGLLVPCVWVRAGKQRGQLSGEAHPTPSPPYDSPRLGPPGPHLC